MRNPKFKLDRRDYIDVHNSWGVQERLYRIVAKRDIKKHKVLKGERGGYIQNEYMVKPDDDSWVHHGAYVFEGSGYDTYICGDSYIENTRIEECIIKGSLIKDTRIGSNNHVADSHIKYSNIGEKCRILYCNIKNSTIYSKCYLTYLFQVSESFFNEGIKVSNLEFRDAYLLKTPLIIDEGDICIYVVDHINKHVGIRDRTKSVFISYENTEIKTAEGIVLPMEKSWVIKKARNLIKKECKEVKKTVSLNRKPKPPVWYKP